MSTILFLALLVAVFLALTWLSAASMFLFLHEIVRYTKQVVEPASHDPPRVFSAPPVPPELARANAALGHFPRRAKPPLFTPNQAKEGEDDGDPTTFEGGFDIALADKPAITATEDEDTTDAPTVRGVFYTRPPL